MITFRPLLVLILIVVSEINADSCDDWFKQAKIKLGPECIQKCSVLSTGMATFNCPLRCKEYCDTRSFWEKILGNLAYYPGLTSKEKDLITQHPAEAVKVYQQMQIAESSTDLLFGRDAQDDESDAYRHFVWAALLSLEIGSELAKEFLDAHEFDHMETPSSAMDLANNRAGLIAADKLRKEGKLNQENIEKEGRKELNGGTLVVLKPRGGPIK